MKTAVISAIMLVLVAGLLFAATGVFEEPFYWSTAGSTSAKIVTSSKDTSQVFSLVTPATTTDRSRQEMVTGLGVWWKAVANADSVNVYLSLDVSADNSNWVEFAKIDSLITSDLSTLTGTAYKNVDLTELPPSRWGRIRVTGFQSAGDTTTVTGSVIRAF